MANVTFEEIETLNKTVESYYAKLGYDVHVSPTPHLHDAGIREINGVKTGGGICKSDMELMVTMSRIFTPNAIYGVGNAFGLSTITLGQIFQTIPIDIIDAEVEGDGNTLGSTITRQIAKNHNLNVNLYTGFSPVDTYKALRSELYDFVFIDGLHTNEQLFLDMIGIYARLSPKCIVMLHDVKLCKLYDGIKRFCTMDPSFKFCTYKSKNYVNGIGTGFLYRGFSDKIFESISEEYTYNTQNFEGFLLNDLSTALCTYNSNGSTLKIHIDGSMTFVRSNSPQYANFQWVGRFVGGQNKYVVDFDIKFKNFIPKVIPDVGLRLSDVPIVYNDWISDCELNKWHHVHYEITRIHSNNHIILISFDSAEPSLEYDLNKFTVN